MEWYKGQTVFFIENNYRVKEATITSLRGEFAVLRYDGYRGVRLRTSRLYTTAEDARKHIPGAYEIRYGYQPPQRH